MRVHNFSAGPAALPRPALERAQHELFDFAGTGVSVMEISHRTREFEALNREAQSLLRELMNVPRNYKILFLQGGASLQFGMVPMNLLAGKSADYILTGVWGEKAHKEAKRFGTARVAATTAPTNHDRIPSQQELQLDSAAQYVHITTNNTISGTQWHYIPETGKVPLIADMSSDILSRPVDVSRYALIYAGAQKNMGIAGLTAVIIREDLLERCPSDLTSMLNYRIHSENDSLYNTIPTFAVYMTRNVLEWLKAIGGLSEIERINRAKATLLYDCIERHPKLYDGHAVAAARSLMNVTFRLPTPELEKKFLAGCAERNMMGVRGHRLVGGCRASIYNAVPIDSVRALVTYMDEFAAHES